MCGHSRRSLLFPGTHYNTWVFPSSLIVLSATFILGCVMLNYLKITHFRYACKETLYPNTFTINLHSQIHTTVNTNNNHTGAWPQQVTFTLPGHLFTYLAIPECPCCLEYKIYSRICHDYGLMIFDY